MPYTVIKTTWNSFAKQVTKEAFPLHSVVKNVNRSVLEAYKLSNLHILRCIQENIEFTIDQSFYFKCLSAVSELKKRKNTVVSNPDLLNTLTLYNSRKPLGYNAPAKDYMGGLFNNAAQQMFTMAKNYFVYTFYKRLYKYLKRKYILWSGYEIASFIKDVYNEKYKGYNPEVWKIKEILNYELPYSDNVIPAFYKFLRFSEATRQRLFTLLPNRSTFTVCYVKIDTTCLHDILISCKYMKRDNKFMEKRRDYWTQLFNIEDFETRNKEFAYEFLTDGKAVSIVLRKDEKPEKEIHISDYDVVWGLDPGRSNVFTAVSDQGDFVKVSTPEYYFDSKVTEKNKKYSKWYENDMHVNNVFKSLPSLKTSNMDQFLSYLDKFFMEADYLLDFHFRKPFRDVKFKTYVFAQKKLHKMCLSLTKGDKQTIIGFGDWSNMDSPVIRKPKGPVKRFKDCLKKYATVIDIDEFKTSKTCSCCYEELERTKVYTVLRCKNTLCERNLVNRDRNAANNILCLVQHHVRQEPRPPCFRRT